MKQAKRLISMVLTVVMLLSNLPGLTFASTPEESIETTEPTITTEVTELTSWQETQVSTEDFTFTVLDGTYCEFTSYNGTDPVVEIPFEYEALSRALLTRHSRATKPCTTGPRQISMQWMR